MNTVLSNSSNKHTQMDTVQLAYPTEFLVFETEQTGAFGEQLDFDDWQWVVCIEIALRVPPTCKRQHANYATYTNDSSSNVSLYATASIVMEDGR